jgi:hypothetical protein
MLPTAASRRVPKRRRQTMDTTMHSRTRNGLEGFLEELALQVQRLEDLDAVLEILRTLRDERIERARESRASADSGVEQLDRYDIFKIYANQFERVAFVRGAENARKVLLHFNARGDAVYFLRQSDVD